MLLTFTETCCVRHSTLLDTRASRNTCGPWLPGMSDSAFMYGPHLTGGMGQLGTAESEPVTPHLHVLRSPGGGSPGRAGKSPAPTEGVETRPRSDYILGAHPKGVICIGEKKRKEKRRKDCYCVASRLTVSIL